MAAETARLRSIDPLGLQLIGNAHQILRAESMHRNFEMNFGAELDRSEGPVQKDFTFTMAPKGL